jgi:hypothetical protein
MKVIVLCKIKSETTSLMPAFDYILYSGVLTTPYTLCLAKWNSDASKCCNWNLVYTVTQVGSGMTATASSG